MSTYKAKKNPARACLLKEGKVCIRAKWLIGTVHLQHGATRSISTLRRMGCWSISGLLPALNSRVNIYTPGWREALWEWSVLPKKTITQCPRPGLEPRLLDPETSAQTMRPPPLSRLVNNSIIRCWESRRWAWSKVNMSPIAEASGRVHRPHVPWSLLSAEIFIQDISWPSLAVCCPWEYWYWCCVSSI